MWNLCVSCLVVCFLGSTCGQTDIRKPPTITKHPWATVIYLSYDDSVTLECKAEGIPGVTYEWKKNGAELNPNLPNIRKDMDGTITIRNAAASDEGFYQCFAKNQYGTALSITAHIQRALLDSASGTPTTHRKTVQEGMPFHIQADPRKSFPKPIYGWEMAADTVDKNPMPILPSRRIQFAENGDLHFAFALPVDDLGGKIYKCTTYNEALDVKAGGSYTKITVTRNPAGISPFAPTLGFASETQTVGVIGGSVKLRCFFYGYPEPTISWSGPRNTLPIGRYAMHFSNTELTINSITASDEGDYICSVSNTQGRNTHTLQIRVEVIPRFLTVKDGPRDVNVTEGESFTFNCKANATPEATIVWLQDGKQLDPDNPPKRFRFSDNSKSLTIRDVCRDCDDRDKQTDLTVIQCNASNVHGYAFSQGYVNVLVKTKVTIIGSRIVYVDFLEERQFVFRCDVTSDPSTPPTVRWYKIKPYGDLVRDEPPYVFVAKEFLIIMTYPNCSTHCAKYLGEYRCVGDNGYSQDNRTIDLSYRPPSEVSKNDEVTCVLWTVILGAIVLVLLLIGVFLCVRSKRRYAINRRTKDRKLPNPPSMYERVDYESAGIPLEGIGNNGRSMRRAYSMYEHVGYDSIDQVLEDMARREAAIPNSSDANAYSGYESIDLPQRAATDIGRPMQDEDTMYNYMGYSIPLEEITNRVEPNQHQVLGNEFALSQSKNFPVSTEQSDSKNPYSDLSRKDFNPELDLGISDKIPREMNPYLDLGISDKSPREMNPYLDLGISGKSPREMNPYLDLGISDKSPREMNPYLDLGISDGSPREMNPYLDLGISDKSPREMNPYLDLSSKDINPPLDLEAKEVNPDLDLSSKDVDLRLDLDSKQEIPYLDMDKKKLDPSLDIGQKVFDPYLDMGLKEVNPYLCKDKKDPC